MKFVHLNIKTDYSIGKGFSKMEDYISACKKFGMNTLAITNYNNLFGAIKFYKHAKSNQVKPIIGIELTTKEGDFLIYCKNFEGYKKLMIIASNESNSFNDIFNLKDVVVVSSFKNLINKKDILDICEKFKEVFKEDFYLEIFNEKSLDNISKSIYLSQKYNIDLVATNNVHYLEKEDYKIAEIISSIKNESPELNISYFKNQEEMFIEFQEHKKALENTTIIANKCNLEIPIENFVFVKIEDSKEKLKEAIKLNFYNRYEKNEKIISRLNKELDIILKKGFQDYFLIVKDIIDFCSRNKIMIGPGRGSAAASIVSYILKITNVDPIKYNLLFERFLNYKRVKKPDIDIDICFEKRDQVLDYVKNKYNGKQIIAFGKMSKKLILIELSKFYKLPLKEYFDEYMNILKDFSLSKEILYYVKKLEGNIWTKSTHASGVILTTDIEKYSPLINSTTTQYDMEELDYLGLIKIDLLGLKTITLIDKISKSIGKDIGALPLDDLKTFQLLKQGKTKYIFQLESTTAKNILKSIKLGSIESLSYALALNRPGPLKSNLNLNKLEDSLIYQEDVMNFVSSFTNVSLEDSEILIRAISKKDLELLKEYKKIFYFNAKENGKTDLEIKDALLKIEKVSSYGFNKAHSICYALLSYYCSYFKANHLKHFLSAILNLDHSSLELINKYVNLKHPNVNQSSIDSKVYQESILLGLSFIKTIPGNVLNTIIDRRPYESFKDFLNKNKNLNESIINSLIFSGSFDQFEGTRIEKSLNQNQLSMFRKSDFNEKDEEIKNLGLFINVK